MPDPRALSWHPVETVGLLFDGLGQFIVCFDRRETQLNARLVDSHLPLERTISRISDTAQTGKFRVKIFCVFPNSAPSFGKIPDPENTLPDLELCPRS